jgi:16S rRNA (adenine1518-N6/adenine1519-N6)-dimethyltransferase
MVYAKKSLGQHFLTSEKALREMVNAQPVVADDLVLEIGPGRGALTKFLLRTSATIIAIEKDPEMIEVLTATFAEQIASKQLLLITGDVLAIDPDMLESLCGSKRYSVVANIPYYITGEIMRLFLTIEPRPTSMTLLVQREVAQRIARSEKESILSLSVKLFGTPKYMSTVPAGAFSPPPRVDSAVLHIRNITGERADSVGEAAYFKAVKLGFSARRKMLLGNLSAQYTRESIMTALATLSLSEKIRGEDMMFDQWLQFVPLLIEKSK